MRIKTLDTRPSATFQLVTSVGLKSEPCGFVSNASISATTKPTTLQAETDAETTDGTDFTAMCIRLHATSQILGASDGADYTDFYSFDEGSSRNPILFLMTPQDAI